MRPLHPGKCLPKYTLVKNAHLVAHSQLLGDDGGSGFRMGLDGDEATV